MLQAGYVPERWVNCKIGKSSNLFLYLKSEKCQISPTNNQKHIYIVYMRHTNDNFGSTIRRGGKDKLTKGHSRPSFQNRIGKKYIIENFF